MKKKKSIIGTIIKIFFILLIPVIIAGGIYLGLMFAETEKVDEESLYDHLQKSSYVYDSSGDLIANLYYTEDRKIIKAETLPDEVKNAFIAVEDKTFYKHHGFNWKRIAGAIYEKITGKSDSISGTSTITQQLARNVYLPDIKSERSIKRKLIEMMYAFKIERAMTKDEIIEAYLNTIYLGYGCYGIKSASEAYFSKSPDDLEIEEIAILASLPQAPDTYAPIKTEESDTTTKIKNGLYADHACQERRDLILQLMYEQGYISEKEKQEAEKPIEDILNPAIYTKDSTYTYFKDYLIQQVRADLMDKYSLTEEEADEMIYTGGLKIHSTIDSSAQKILTEEFSNDGTFPYNYGEKPTEAAMVITEVGTGKIIAMSGGRNVSGERLFNRAINPRQPGSSIKPLSVYSAALQKSLEYCNSGKYFEFADYNIDKQGASGWGQYITASSLVTDEATHVDGDTWPLNFTRSYSGKRTFRTALQQSINTCAVKILYQVGIDYSLQTLENYGISTLKLSGATNDVNVASLALGAMTYGVTPLDMALAYGAFPNSGLRNSPVCYTSVEDADGNTILTSNAEETQVLDEGVAWIMTDVLKSVVSDGIAYPAAIRGTSVGGKTGTTDKNGDIWFVGFTPKYSAALWIGADDNSELSQGSAVAAKIWSQIMGQIPGVTEGSYKSQPESVVRVNGEYYTKGTEPAYVYTPKKSSKKTEQKQQKTPEPTVETVETPAVPDIEPENWETMD